MRRNHGFIAIQVMACGLVIWIAILCGLLVTFSE